MADERSGSLNTAIVAIVALIVVLILVWFFVLPRTKETKVFESETIEKLTPQYFEIEEDTSPDRSTNIDFNIRANRERTNSNSNSNLRTRTNRQNSRR